MLLRPLLVAGCLLLPLSGWAAATPPQCPQLTDPAGDQNPSDDPAADLRSVTIGSDRSSITLVLHYGGEHASQTPGGGHDYTVDLNTGEAGLTAQALIGDSGPTYALYRHTVSQSESGSSASGGTGIGRLSGRVDEQAHTVTMTLPFAMAPDILRPRQLLAVSATAFVSEMTPDVQPLGRFFIGSGSDKSDKPADYRVGVRSCAARRA